MEMEIRKDYQEVLLMLEGVLLHIFRGLKGRSLVATSPSPSLTPYVTFY